MPVLTKTSKSLNASAPRDITSPASNSSSIYRTTNSNFNSIRSLVLLLLALSLASTCSLAQDTNTNTAGKSEKPEVIGEVKSKVSQPSVKEAREYVCPNYELAGLALLFSVPCKTNKECTFLGPDQRCCKRFCRKGVPAPPKEPRHRAVLGLNRMCPKEPVPEILPVKKCLSDIDCEEERRVCCPDKDLKLYCRTAAPVWSELPFPRAHELLMSLLGYMQCQMAPPPLLDLFPQPCNRTIDCLPNLCCQEGANKFCRPAKKSVLALAAQATQRFTRG